MVSAVAATSSALAETSSTIADASLTADSCFEVPAATSVIACATCWLTSDDCSALAASSSEEAARVCDSSLTCRTSFRNSTTMVLKCWDITPTSSFVFTSNVRVRSPEARASPIWRSGSVIRLAMNKVATNARIRANNVATPTAIPILLRAAWASTAGLPANSTPMGLPAGPMIGS